MSKIHDIVMKHIREYDLDKTGKWMKQEKPPANTFDLSDIYIIGRAIVSELEGKLADSYLTTL